MSKLNFLFFSLSRQRFRSWSMGSKRAKSKSSSRSSSSEPEELKASLEDDEHREVAQIRSGSTTPSESSDLSFLAWRPLIRIKTISIL